MYSINVRCESCGNLSCEFIIKKGEGEFRKNYLTLAEIKKPSEVMAFLKKNGYYICTKCGKKSWE